MARMLGAQWRPLPGSSTTKIASYDIFCLHTMVGGLAGTDNYFRTSAAGTNSHFGVGADRTIYQWVDTAYRSGANLNGNYHIISVETADTGAPFAAWTGSNVPAWTADQVESLAQLAAWAHNTHGIPLELIPDAKPGRRGVGYHRQGVPGYMVAGAEKWSNATGKVCPGDRRIAQIPQVIARAKQIATPTAAPATATDWFDMATRDELVSILRSEGISGAADPSVFDPMVRKAVSEETAKVLRTEGVSGAGDVGRIADALTPALSAKLGEASDGSPAGTLTKTDVEDALRSVFAGLAQS